MSRTAARTATATRSPHAAPRGVRRLGRAVLSASAAAALVAAGAAGAAGAEATEVPGQGAGADSADGGRTTTGFARVSTYDVPGGVAEIVAATDDGKTLVYTDSGAEQVGVVDVSDPAAPAQVASVDVGGEPTSVAVRGRLALVAVDGPDDLAVVDLDAGAVVARLPLGGQPDSIALSPDGRWAAVVVENQRDEDVDGGAMPQDPPGYLVVVDTGAAGPGGDDPTAWTTRRVDLTGLDGARFPTDPEPEFVDVDERGVAAVTLQENDAVALVDLASGEVTGSFSAGTSTHPADLADDGDISFTDTLTDARREPDAIAWTPSGNLVIANEGDYDVDLGPDEHVGGRGFTVFSPEGEELFDVGDRFEVEGALRGHYPDSRSDARGTEVEGVETGTYGGSEFLFVGSERGSYVGVYRTDRAGGDAEPQFVQALPTGTSPEGILALPQRDLLVVTGEVEGTLSIYAGTASPSRGGPDPSASVDLYATSLDSAFGALSGLSPAPDGKLYAVPDDAFSPSRVFTIDPAPFRAGTGPALVTDTVRLTRDGESASYDLEGVAQRAGGGWWVVSEGAVDDEETPEDERTPNLLVSVDADGAVAQEVPLPEAVDAARTGRGLEGVATSPDGSQVYVVVQDAGSDDVVDGLRYAKVGRYDVASGDWGFARYPLPVAPDGARVGLSEIAAVGDGTFAVVERDDLSGAAARLKQVWTVDLGGVPFAPAGGELPVLTKTPARDLLGAAGRSGEVGLPESGPWRAEKLEGLARADDGTWYAVNDNDGAGESDLRAFSSLSADGRPDGAGTGVPQLVGQGLVPGSFDGVPVGGLSGITYDAARRVYHAISDDRGDLAPARFYTLRAALDADGAPQVRVVSSTTLTDPAGKPFAPGVTDTEGIALTGRGTLVITSEGDVGQLIPPFVREFGLDGRQLRDLPIPADLVPAADGTSGIRDNLALEPATVTPDGGGLTGTEGSLVQDGPVSTTQAGSTDRIIRYDPTGQPVAQYAYPLGPIPDAPVPADAFAVTGLVELAAISDEVAYSLERSFSTGVGNAVSLYRIDLSGATDVTGRSLAGGSDGVVPVSKELVLDLGTLGITLDNLEGMTLGPVLPDGRQSLVLVADDNFSDTQANQVVVLAL